MAARFIRSRWRGTVPLTRGDMPRPEYEAWYDAHAWSPSPASGLVSESDLAPAAWIEPRLRARSFDVSMTAPQGFEAYARILFPFAGEDIETDGTVTSQEHITWTETARRNRRVAHALMEQETILAPGQEATCLNELADEQFDALLPILTRHTSSAHGWFLLWDGFGDLNQDVFGSQPKVSHPMRDFYLLSGTQASYRNLPHDPNYWWPDDRSWCLCTDTDFYWAYIAGSEDCVSDVLSVPELDAYETNPCNPARRGMDVINDPHGFIARYTLNLNSTQPRFNEM
jgi:hypothetical protein